MFWAVPSTRRRVRNREGDDDGSGGLHFIMAGAPARLRVGCLPRRCARRGQGSLTRAQSQPSCHFAGKGVGLGRNGVDVTSDRARKRAARARAASTGERYVVARRHASDASPGIEDLEATDRAVERPRPKSDCGEVCDVLHECVSVLRAGRKAHEHEQRWACEDRAVSTGHDWLLTTHNVATHAVAIAAQEIGVPYQRPRRSLTGAGNRVPQTPQAGAARQPLAPSSPL